MDDAATHGPDAGQDISPERTPAPAPAPAKDRNLATALRTPMSWPRRRRIGALLAVAALATTSGVAFAATSDPTPSVTPSTSESDVKADKVAGEKKRMHEKGMTGKRMHPGMGMGLGMGRGGVVHGEFTTPDGEDGYATQMIQTGTVDAVSGDKLTVKSADGYSHDYAMSTDTVVNGARNWSAEGRGGVAAGQTVTVLATVKDGTATAVQVRGSNAKAGEEGNVKMKKFRGGPGMGMTGPGGQGQRFQMAPDEMKKRLDMRREGAVPAPAAPSGAVPQDDVAVPTPSA